MKCHLCLRDKKGVDAHVIPRSFFEAMKVNGRQDYLVMASNKLDVFDKRSRIGIYDPTILCADCEAVFSPWDNYAARLLLTKNGPEDVLKDHSDRPIARVLGSYDYDQLMLFFISVLWRASVSTRQFYSRVDAGPYEETLRQSILNSDPSLSDRLSVTLAQFVNYDNASQTFFDPYRTRFGGVNCWVFFFATYVACMKLDSRPTPPPFDKAVLRQGKPLIVVLRDYRRSSDRRIFSSIAAAIQKRAAARRAAKNP
jgi:hypothetical protein